MSLRCQRNSLLQIHNYSCNDKSQNTRTYNDVQIVRVVREFEEKRVGGDSLSSQ